MKPMERLAVRGDVTLWCERFGRREHEPVLLIAGANAPASMWPDALIANLVEHGYRVMRYDHRDTGRSTTRDFDRAPYAINDLALDAIAVLDAYDVRRAHVVGLSMGGTIAQILAIDHAERLNSLTVMMTTALDVDFAAAYARAAHGADEAHGDLPGPDPAVVRRLNEMHAPGENEVEEIARRVAVWRALNGGRLVFDAEEFAARERRAIAHAGTVSPPVAHGRAQPVSVKRGAELRRVTSPTLVIQAGQDPLNPPPHGRRLADLIPTARFVELPKLGHALPSSILDEMAALLASHFDENTATPP